MDDLIRRQDAIDDIWTVSPLARLDRKWVDRWLRQLPPAQPKPLQPWEVLAAQAVLPQPKMGKWIKKHRHYGGFRSYTGFDAMGEQHTITVDERAEYDDLYCSECGARSADNFLNFCPRCGSYNGGEQYG